MTEFSMAELDAERAGAMALHSGRSAADRTVDSGRLRAQFRWTQRE
jgi:hypothetical protein